MKTLLITGASSGIGRATALAAADSGWRVIACGRNEERLEALQNQAPDIETLAFDLTDPDACRGELSDVTADAVVLNAGICEYVDVADWDSAMFRRVFDANFFSAINCLEVLLPKLKAGNQLVFVDCLARLLPFTRSEAYGASKAAIHYLAKSLEVDLKGCGIRVQSVSPGFVRTPLTDRNEFAMPMRVEPEDAAAAIMDSIHSGRGSSYFPTVFAGVLRLMGALPHSVQTAICARLARRAEVAS